MSRRSFRLAAVLAASSAAGTAAADDGNTNLFQPAGTTLGYFRQESPAVVAARALQLGATLDAAEQLLVVRDPATGDALPDGEVVAHRLAMHLAATVGVRGRFELGAGLTAAWQQGDGTPMREAVPAAGLGDVRLRGKLRAVSRGAFALALTADLALPTATADALLGDPAPALTPGVAAGVAIGRFDAAVTAGYRIRRRARVGDLLIDDELVGGIAARYAVVPARIWIQAEAFGALGVQARGNRLERPLESIVGARARISETVMLQAGVGLGLTEGYGTPDVRGIVTALYTRAPAPPGRAPIAWMPAEEPRPAPESAPAPVVTVIDDRIVLPESVLFAIGGDQLEAGATRVLTAVVAAWAAQPTWESMMIEGHTDRRGTAAANQALSERRASAVMAALIRLGIDPARLAIAGFGESRPVSAGATEADHARDRRVELVITRRRSAP